MTTRRRRRAPSGGFRTFPKRSTLWLPFDVSAELATPGTAVETGDLLGNYFAQTGEEVPIGTTLGPVRGQMAIHPTTATAPDRLFQLEAVMQLNREGGRATLPIPGVDIIDAMWYGQMFYTSEAQEVSAGAFRAPTVSAELLTNAMRKVTGNGQTLTITAISEVANDYNFRAIGVVMLKLP